MPEEDKPKIKLSEIKDMYDLEDDVKEDDVKEDEVYENDDMFEIFTKNEDDKWEKEVDE